MFELLIRRAGWLLLALAAVSCGDDGIQVGTTISVSLEGLRDLDPATEGTYEAWITDSGGNMVSLGRFLLPKEGRVIFENPVGTPSSFMITLEPPGDDDDQPSIYRLLGGTFDGSVAELRIDGYVTAGPPLEEHIGTHVLFTPANNAWRGYPSDEDAGIWIFNIRAIADPMRRQGLDLSSEFFLKVTPLSAGWTYEGWVVHDYGKPTECWISYGKMVPGEFNRLNLQDNTGFGPFSGYTDYVGNPLAIQHNFPGDDWVENPYGFPVPCGLELPFDMNGNSTRGIKSPWTHVITIEPAFDLLTESPEVDPAAPLTARPFLIRPYRDAFGEGPADEPRLIQYDGAQVPRGRAALTGL